MQTSVTLHRKTLSKYYAGQYAFVNFPTVSALEWHPFTISSAPSGQHVTFHIKV